MKYWLKYNGGEEYVGKTAPRYDEIARYWVTDIGLYSDTSNIYSVRSEDEGDLVISPPQFLLLFSSKERLKIRSLAKEDDFMADFMLILSDSRLESVDIESDFIREFFNYLKDEVGVISEERYWRLTRGLKL